MTITPHHLQGVFTIQIGKRTLLLTKNLVPGQQVYGERLVKDGKDEYREWNPTKSKLGAAIMKGVSQVGIKHGSIVLYLGCASGTTASHVSDMVGQDGAVFALDHSSRVVRDIVPVCEARRNMSPILADARHAEEYFYRVVQADVVFQDIAQKDQAAIFLKNCALFLKPGGFGLLSVKAKSIDITKKPSAIFDHVRRALEQEMAIVDYRNLEPFEKDHCLFVCKKKEK